MTRFRDFRKTEELRQSIRETVLEKENFIQPFFVVEGENKKEPIESMPGIFRYSTDQLNKAIEAYIKNEGHSCLLFGIPNKKDSLATEAYAENGIIQKAIRSIKQNFPEFFVITDVCLCAYMDHGHCGVVKDNDVDNDATLPLLGKVAVSHAQAGCDMVAPSDMMDFRIRQIREDLDANNFEDFPIMSYAAKYESAFYGPFREAADSAPVFGDRKTYQMDPANVKEAVREVKQDIEEGANVVMIKPALAYLDVIRAVKSEVEVPVAAYNVSGEYSMIKAAASKGWLDEKAVVLESLTAIKRAGASIIISYFSKDVLEWL